jgi:hypothetical protein
MGGHMDTPRHKRFLYFMRCNTYKLLVIFGTISIIFLITTLILDAIDAHPALQLASVICWACPTFSLGFLEVDLRLQQWDRKRKITTALLKTYYINAAIIALFYVS